MNTRKAIAIIITLLLIFTITSCSVTDKTQEIALKDVPTSKSKPRPTLVPTPVPTNTPVPTEVLLPEWITSDEENQTVTISTQFGDVTFLDASNLKMNDNLMVSFESKAEGGEIWILEGIETCIIDHENKLVRCGVELKKLPQFSSPEVELAYFAANRDLSAAMIVNNELELSWIKECDIEFSNELKKYTYKNINADFRSEAIRKSKEIIKFQTDLYIERADLRIRPPKISENNSHIPYQHDNFMGSIKTPKDKIKDIQIPEEYNIDQFCYGIRYDYTLKKSDEENPYKYIEMAHDYIISLRRCGGTPTQENFNDLYVKLFDKKNPMVVSLLMRYVHLGSYDKCANIVDGELIPIMIQYKGEEMEIALAYLYNLDKLKNLFYGFRFSEKNAFETTMGEVAEKHDIDIP